MTDFTPGAIITHDNSLCDVWPPSWLRDDVLHEARSVFTDTWFQRRSHRDGWHLVTAIRLDASDIVYQCIAWNEAHPDEAPMWPWYGGHEAPADVAGYVLFRDGTSMRLAGMYRWSHDGLPADPIGYQRRPTTSLPEPAEERQPLDESLRDAWLAAECERAGGVFFTAEQVALMRDIIAAIVKGEAK